MPYGPDAKPAVGKTEAALTQVLRLDCSDPDAV